MSKIKANEEKRRQRQSEREGDRGIEGREMRVGGPRSIFKGKNVRFRNLRF